MLVALLYVYLLTIPCPVPSYPETGVIRDPKHISAMRYHGIRHAQEATPGGKWIFFRAGRKCSLYTQAFETWYAKETSK
jgi:hypothetical protein